MNAPLVDPFLDRCREASASGPLGLRDLVALQDATEIASDTLDALREPDPAHPYGRKVLLGGDGIEVMVATWTRGIPCVPHDHGGALGAVKILQGRARHRIWKVEDRTLRLVREHVAEAGELLACGADLIHSMGDDGADAPLMTMHMYTPTIDFMVLYDQHADRTLVVDGECGAWLPPADRVRDAWSGILPRADIVDA